MRKIKMLKVTGIIIAIMVLIAMIIVFALMFNHNIKLRKEAILSLL